MTPVSSLRLIPAGARPRERDAVPLVALALAWIVVVLVVDPRGNFPLNDDWAYGSVVRALIEHGRLEPNFWQGMPLVTHALWGAAFARLFGFSWFALRLSSLAAGGLALWGLYFFLREVGWRRARATAGAATLLVNPWFVALAHTFMTDVPFLAAVTWSVWAWMRAVGRRDVRWLALAAGLAVVATLSRQVGLALPIAFAFPMIRRRAFRWWAVAAPLALAVLALVVHDHLRHASAAPAAVYDGKAEALWRGAIGLCHLQRWDRVGARVVVALAYLGLFALPAALSVAVVPEARRRVAWPVVTAIGVAAGMAVLLAGWSMPLIGNIVIDFGIGPRTLAGVVPGAAAGFWWAMTVAAAVGAAFLVRAVVDGFGEARRRGGMEGQRWKPLACALVAATLFAPTAIADTTMFDRHLLVLLPFVLGALPADPPPAASARRAIAVAAGAVMALFAVGTTHDYLAWNRARWNTVEELKTGVGVRPADIEAGFEIDNLPAAGDAAAAAALADNSAAPLVVAASPLPGHEVVRRVDVHPWLGRAVRAVYVLARPRR